MQILDQLRDPGRKTSEQCRPVHKVIMMVMLMMVVMLMAVVVVMVGVVITLTMLLKILSSKRCRSDADDNLSDAPKKAQMVIFL